MRGLKCPVCNTDNHQPQYEKDGLYVCSKCGKVLGYLCSGCDVVYLENRLIKHTDLYICKVCGRPQYGYTEWKTKKGRDS